LQARYTGPLTYLQEKHHDMILAMHVAPPLVHKQRWFARPSSSPKTAVRSKVPVHGIVGAALHRSMPAVTLPPLPLHHMGQPLRLYPHPPRVNSTRWTWRREYHMPAPPPLVYRNPRAAMDRQMPTLHDTTYSDPSREQNQDTVLL